MSQRPVHHRPASTNRPLYLHRSGGASSGSGSSSTATFHSFAALLAKTATLRTSTLHHSRSGGVEDVAPSACSTFSSSFPSTHAPTTTTAAAAAVVVPSAPRPSTVPVPAIESRTSSSSTGSGTTTMASGLSGSRSGGGFARWPSSHPPPSTFAMEGAPLVSSSVAPTLRFAFPSASCGEMRALPQDPSDSMPNESVGVARFTMIHDTSIQPNAPAVTMTDPPIQSVMQNFSANHNITSSSRPLSSRADMEAQLERDRHRRVLDDIWRQLQTTRRQLQDATQIHLTALQNQAQRYEILAKQSASYHQLDCEEREERFRIVAAFFRSKPTEKVPRVVSDPPRSVRDSDLLRTLRAKDRVVDYLLEELTQRGWTAPSLRSSSSSYARGEEEGMDLKERLMRYCSTPMDALAQKVAVVPSLEPAATWVYLSLPKPPQAPSLPDAGTTVEQERFSGATVPPAAGAEAMLGARTWSGGDSGKRRPATQPGGRRKRLMVSQ